MYILAALLGCLTLIAGAGYLYQWAGARRDRLRYAGDGRQVEIGNDCSLYLVQKGSGSPAVVFESGIAATNLNWRHIQEAVSSQCQTVSYDRAGLGWSSPATTARTPANIAAELRRMLAAAGVQPPFVLVGHSFGGMVVRRFAQLFPEEVSGLVLVDPMRCEEWPPLDAARQATLDRGVRMAGYAVSIARFGVARLALTSLLCRTGRISALLARATGEGCKHVLRRIEDEVGKLPEEMRPAIAAHWSRPSFYVGMAEHIRSVPQSVREMLATEPICGLPITLLTPGRSPALSGEQLRQIGDRVQQVVASGSAHWVHLDEPDLVVNAIRERVAATTARTTACAR